MVMERGSSTARGYGSRWQKARATYLCRNPLCVECFKQSKVVPATVVDHIRPHKGDQKLFWDRDNWAALCKRHHDSKTAREDGGFGRPTGVRGCDVTGMPLDPGHPWSRSPA